MTATTLPSPSAAKIPGILRIFGEVRFHADGELLALAFSQNGALLSVEEPGLLRSWNTAGEELDCRFLSDAETVWQFSQDACLLGSGSSDLSLWDANTGQLLDSVTQPSWITALAFREGGGRFVASGHDDGRVRVWEMSGGRLKGEFVSHQRPISALAFSADGSRLASAGEDKIVCIWEVETGRLLGTLTGHTDRIQALAWHPHGQCLVSAGWDTTARLWDTHTFTPIILLNEHACQLTALALSPDGHLIACADSQDTVHVWDQLEHHRFEGHQGPVASLAFSADGLTLASGGTDRIIRLWKLPQGKPVCPGEKAGRAAPRWAFSPARTSMALSPTGNELAHCHDTTLRIWDSATAKVRFHSPGAGSFQSLAYSSDGHWLAAGTDSAIDLWDTALGEFRIRLEDEDQREPVTALAFCPGSLTLASASATSTAIWIWDVQEEEPSLLIPDALDGCTVLALAFQPQGRLLAAGGIDWLATGGSNGAVSLWDLEKRCEVMTFSLGALCLAFHPSSRWLASGTLEKSICIWDLVEQQLAAELMGHEDTVNCVAYSPDGRWLASGSDDRTLCIWDAGTGKLLARKALNTQIKALAFAQDRTSLFTANGNDTCYWLQLPVSLLNKS